MAEIERLICESSELLESGKGIRFTVQFEGEETAAFVDAQVVKFMPF